MTIEDLVAGKIKQRNLEKHTKTSTEAVELRRAYIAKQTKTDLAPLAPTALDLDAARTYNLENMIGATQIPVGITDPLLVNGQFASGSFYIPLATTEKSLVASISRGCKAVSQAGGATTIVLDDKMTRAPVFVVPTISKGKELVDWVKEHFTELETIVTKGSRFAKLLSYKAWIVGKSVFLQFAFFTGDAMGMNMATKASAKICSYIEQKLGFARWISDSGNMCVDKKPSALTLIEGRGKSVIAEAVLPRTIIEQTLKTTPAAIAEVAYRKNLVGSAQAASFGMNAHFANMVAAMYIATGQDAAHVVSASLGFSLFEQVDNDLHASVSIPALEVGTVGGGTRLAPQQAALQMLGCLGPGDPPGTHAKKLAEIIAATVLAGELSLIAAEAAHHLAEAHMVTAK
jgi:hydroxymethylglutaryl-CoA reductase (NADPH)